MALKRAVCEKSQVSRPGEILSLRPICKSEDQPQETNGLDLVNNTVIAVRQVEIQI